MSEIEQIGILDLGCGTGIDLEEIFKKCPKANVTAIDMSQGMLEKLRDKFSKRSEQLQGIKFIY